MGSFSRQRRNSVSLHVAQCQDGTEWLICRDPLEGGSYDGPCARRHAGNQSHFWFTDFFWDDAAFDCNIVAGWNWSGDQMVIYEDSDHFGWYLDYNPRLGPYAHVEYLSA
ncbi:MAG: hypothetical protein ACLQU1_22315 [Bryobacteraceae bacterium]